MHYLLLVYFNNRTLEAEKTCNMDLSTWPPQVLHFCTGNGHPNFTQSSVLQVHPLFTHQLTLGSVQIFLLRTPGQLPPSPLCSLFISTLSFSQLLNLTHLRYEMGFLLLYTLGHVSSAQALHSNSQTTMYCRYYKCPPFNLRNPLLSVLIRSRDWAVLRFHFPFSTPLVPWPQAPFYYTGFNHFKRVWSYGIKSHSLKIAATGISATEQSCIAKSYQLIS